MSVSGPGFLARTILFFPAQRTELFAKAGRSGADAVCADLEDGVPPAAKEAARAAVTERVGSWPAGGAELLVRVNPGGSDLGRRDLEALAALPGPGPRVLLPKVEAPEEVRAAASVLGREGEEGFLLPMVESPGGLDRAGAIARSSPAVGALLLGGVDLSAELGAATEWEPLLYARSRIVHAAALAGVGAVDMPFLDMDDPEGLEEETRRAQALGFRGKMAIHPGQVAGIHRAFTPSGEAVDRARRIVERWEGAGGGAMREGGIMIEEPVVRSARRILALAERAGAGDAPVSGAP